MAKIIIFSLDYDGCSDILFTEFFNKPYKNTVEMRKLLLSLREKLQHFLDEKAGESKEDVELYVGSNRQSHELDKHNASRKQNGLCFINLPKLCESKSEAGKPWKFNPLLLADMHNKLPAGSALKDEALICDFDSGKIKTIQYQLLDAAKNHPNDEVHFYFLDDDGENKIFPGLKAHFENEKNAQEMPNNIHLHIIHFDWYGAVFNGEPILIEKAHIQGKKKPTVSANMLASAEVSLAHQSSLFPPISSSVENANTVPKTPSDGNQSAVDKPRLQPTLH